MPLLPRGSLHTLGAMLVVLTMAAAFGLGVAGLVVLGCTMGLTPFLAAAVAGFAAFIGLVVAGQAARLFTEDQP